MSHGTRSTALTAGAGGRAAMTATRDLLGVLLVAATLSVTACQSQPSPAPSTTGHTPTPTRERSAIAFEDAEAAYRNYDEVSDRIAQDYYRGWQDGLGSLVSEESVPNWGDFFAEGEAGGYHMMGSDVIDSVEAWKYEEDDPALGGETVTLRVCIDSTGVQELSPEGIDMLGEGTTGKYFHVITMKHEPELSVSNDPLPDVDDPQGLSWWRWAGAETWYETC